MSQNTNQHYIPQLLLRRFHISEKPRHIYRFRRVDSSFIVVGVDRAGSSRHFYRDGINPAHPDSLDDVLFETESKINPILNEICELHRIPPQGADDYEILIRFIHDLYFRTPSTRARLEREGPAEMGNIMRTPLLAKNIDRVEKTLAEIQTGTAEQRYLAELFQVSTGQQISLSEQTQKILHLKAAGYEHTEVTAELSGRFWRVLLAPKSGPFFIVGDVPVTVHDHNSKVQTGLKHPTSRVSIPLTPTIVLQGCFSPIRQRVVSIDALKVRKLNGVFARVAYREVFSSQPDFTWQHEAGRTFDSRDWMAGTPEAIWPSNSTT